jgi:hypothetical protein
VYPAQAKAEAEAIRGALLTSDLVTKEFFDYRLTAEIERLKGEIESAKSDMIKRIAGLLLAQAALVATLVKLVS